MQPVQPLPELPARKAVPIQAEGLSFAYPREAPLFSGLFFTLRPGQIIGVTGRWPAANPPWAGSF